MAASPHLCLRWNNYQSNLTSVFDQLLQSETFVDVTLAADGHAIKAHRMVLSACSPYFQALFFDNPCQHPIVILKDTRWSELKAVVEYMYRGEISVAQEELPSLLRVAEALKIRGLSELNSSERHATAETSDDRSDSCSPVVAATVSATPTNPEPPQATNWSREETPTPSPRPGKRRRGSGTEGSTPVSPTGSTSASLGGQQHEEGSLEGPLPLVGGNSHATPGTGTGFPQQTIQQQQTTLHQHGSAAVDDLDIKPGIAELIREEERARMLEGAHPWLTTSSTVLSDSYQYQLQALWQKAWATGQGVMQNLRFRERGPFKTWRPETMAEAIMAVLREGLSLSQAARKFDIPYPTFVLYANRVNNMLGPSADGGSELRPKGRGRPQRILTGSWPEDHVHGVIRAVVFRDPTSLPRHFEARDDLSKTSAGGGGPRPSVSRVLGPAEPSSGSTGTSGTTGLRLNNNNGDFTAMPTSSAGLASTFPGIRSMAGPSAANGIEILAAVGNSGQSNGLNNGQNSVATNQNNCLATAGSLGGGLTSSSLFNVLQQEVAEETRLAALNAMTQRLISSLDGDTIASLGMGGLSLTSQQQQQQSVRGSVGSGVESVVPWFGGVDDVEGVEQFTHTPQNHPPNPVHVKQEQLFGE